MRQAGSAARGHRLDQTGRTGPGRWATCCEMHLVSWPAGMMPACDAMLPALFHGRLDPYLHLLITNSSLVLSSASICDIHPRGTHTPYVPRRLVTCETYLIGVTRRTMTRLGAVLFPPFFFLFALVACPRAGWLARVVAHSREEILAPFSGASLFGPSPLTRDVMGTTWRRLRGHVVGSIHPAVTTPLTVANPTSAH